MRTVLKATNSFLFENTNASNSSPKAQICLSYVLDYVSSVLLAVCSAQRLHTQALKRSCTHFERCNKLSSVANARMPASCHFEVSCFTAALCRLSEIVYTSF
ncbi:hypothetical protein MTO96_001516 [Rhipicephalus appendiculatus]